MTKVVGYNMEWCRLQYSVRSSSTKPEHVQLGLNLSCEPANPQPPPLHV